jgi:Astacin (Peptidase family M12A)
MIFEPAHFCVERIIPQEYLRIAREKAEAENPANASYEEAAAYRPSLWRRNRRVLRVAFLEGQLAVQEKVMMYAHQWSQYANITFLFGNDPNAEIRIAFNPDDGSWSALGTDALVEEYYPKQGPTMNFGWLAPTSSERDYSVVLHEFGHALGMIHEHQSPASRIQWNRGAVIRELSGSPYKWDLKKIENNIFASDQSQTQFTKFDPKSIMIYFIPDRWTLNGVTFNENYVLSETDKQFIRARYPK